MSFSSPGNKGNEKRKSIWRLVKGDLLQLRKQATSLRYTYQRNGTFLLKSCLDFFSQMTCCYRLGSTIGALLPQLYILFMNSCRWRKLIKSEKKKEKSFSLKFKWKMHFNHRIFTQINFIFSLFHAHFRAWYYSMQLVVCTILGNFRLFLTKH